MGREAKGQGHKAKIHYAAIRKRNRKGEWIWGVVRYEGRRQKWGFSTLNDPNLRGS